MSTNAVLGTAHACRPAATQTGGTRTTTTLRGPTPMPAPPPHPHRGPTTLCCLQVGVKSSQCKIQPYPCRTERSHITAAQAPAVGRLAVLRRRLVILAALAETVLRRFTLHQVSSRSPAPHLPTHPPAKIELTSLPYSPFPPLSPYI